MGLVKFVFYRRARMSWPYTFFQSRHSSLKGLFITVVLLATGFSMVWINNSENYKARSVRSEFGKSVVSKCSSRAESRGYHQKVAAYSLYGSFEHDYIMTRYVQPLVNTTLTCPSKYPGWTVRIYHDVPLNDTKTRRLLEKYFGDESQVARHVDLCFVGDIEQVANADTPLFPRTWRFLPLLDEQVDVFVSRDGDSPIISREIDAVREWLKSNCTFHVMRDNRYHCVPMLAGMWGAKIYERRHSIRQAALRMFSLPHSYHDTFDQELLWDIIWPLAKTSVVSHDSYCVDLFTPTNNESIIKPFPNQRMGKEFVGGW